MKNYFIGGVAVIALLVGVVAINRHIPTIDELVSAVKGLGAQTASVVDGDCLVSPGGGHICRTVRGLQQATSTVCAVRSPAATSTLNVSSFISLIQGTSTATQITWAKSTTPFATTTLISYNTLASALKATIVATTTLNSGPLPIATSGTDTVFTFSPNTWAVVGIAGNGVGAGTLNQFNLNGLCSVEFDY